MEEISKWSKMRIILLYAIQRNGVKIEELQSLVKNAGLSQDDQEILESLVHLNIPVIKDCLPDTKKMPRKDYTDDIKFSDSRYIPLVKDLMQYSAEGKMDPEIFKTIPFENKKATSVRSSNKPKLVIFILGGVCASEMRCAYEVSNQLPQETEEKSWFSF